MKGNKWHCLNESWTLRLSFIKTASYQWGSSLVLKKPKRWSCRPVPLASLHPAGCPAKDIDHRRKLNWIHWLSLHYRPVRSRYSRLTLLMKAYFVFKMSSLVLIEFLLGQSNFRNQLHLNFAMLSIHVCIRVAAFSTQDYPDSLLSG